MRAALITAGATRNRVDAMRYISAHSSGQTGAHIAEALGPEGILLLGSPEACLRAPDGCKTQTYTDTLDLCEQMEAWVRANPRGVIIHAAAVGDYMIDPDDPQAMSKRPSGQDELLLRLVPAPKILDQIRSWSPEVFLVSFKAAPPGSDGEILRHLATRQRDRTESDVVFANTIGALQTSIVIADKTGTVCHPTREVALSDLIHRIREALET